MRVLIVEDDPRMRQELKLCLQGIALATCECEDGAEALAAYISFQPDWVLMDISMPQVDGLTASRQIKSADAQARICIVTNHDDANLRSAAREAGASAYVLKEELFKLRAIISPNTPPSPL